MPSSHWNCRPVIRLQGAASDTFGDFVCAALRNERQVDLVSCSCHRQTGAFEVHAEFELLAEDVEEATKAAHRHARQALFAGLRTMRDGHGARWWVGCPRPERSTGEAVLFFLVVSAKLTEVRYLGPANVGSPGRAWLADEPGGITGMIWDGLAQGGWLGQLTGLRPGVELGIRVPAAPTRPSAAEPVPAAARTIGAVPAPAATAKRVPLRPGGRRRPAYGGRIALDGTCYERYEGPMSGRAVAGIHLVDTERRDEDFDYIEDMLYGAALRAGWITSTADPTLAAIPEIEIRVGITPPEAE